MLTSLSVKFPEKGKGLKKLINNLRKDKVSVEVKRARGVSIRQITYTSYSGKIRLDKADSVIGAQRSRLLCSEKLRFPENSGYGRFYSTDFSARLCTNMALSILREYENPEKLKIGVYDLDGDSHDFLFHILGLCSDVTVVTENSESYRYELDRTMDELGASAVITKCAQDLSECNLIVAPTPIEETIPLKDSAIVLTVERPKIQINGFVYYKYYLKMPNGFDLLKPQECDEEYFCSALYTLASQYELGSIIPTLCRNNQTTQTVKSLCAELDRNGCE